MTIGASVEEVQRLIADNTAKVKEKLDAKMKEKVVEQVRATLTTILREGYVNLKMPPTQVENPKAPISE